MTNPEGLKRPDALTPEELAERRQRLAGAVLDWLGQSAANTVRLRTPITVEAAKSLAQLAGVTGRSMGDLVDEAVSLYVGAAEGDPRFPEAVAAWEERMKRLLPKDDKHNTINENN